jgi:hypothetical protein
LALIFHMAFINKNCCTFNSSKEPQ